MAKVEAATTSIASLSDSSDNTKNRSTQITSRTTSQNRRSPSPFFDSAYIKSPPSLLRLAIMVTCLTGSLTATILINKANFLNQPMMLSFVILTLVIFVSSLLLYTIYLFNLVYFSCFENINWPGLVWFCFTIFALNVWLLLLRVYL